MRPVARIVSIAFPSPRSATCCPAWLALLLLALTLPAHAELPYQIEALALAGDPAPGTGGGTFQSLRKLSGIALSAAHLNAAGEVAFWAGVSGGTASEGIFLSSGGGIGAVALAGEPAPGTGGGSYDELFFPDLGEGGEVVFGAHDLASVPSFSGVFLDSGGGDVALAVATLGGGTGLPGTGGGACDFGPDGPPAIGAGGDAAFGAHVSGGSASSGYFLASGGGLTDVAVSGEPAPDSGGGSYDAFVRPLVALNDSGDVAFRYTISGGVVFDGLFLASGGGDSALALRGDPAPGTGGGVFSGFGGAVPLASLDDAGAVAFHALVAGGTAGSGLFLAVDGSISALAVAGGSAPGTGGGTFASFSAPSLNASGEVAFIASIAGGAVSTGLFLASDGSLRAVAVPGDDAPGTGGGSFQELLAWPSLNDAGRIAFVASVSGGTTAQGVFLASPPSPFVADVELRFERGGLAPIPLSWPAVPLDVGVAGSDLLAVGVPALSGMTETATTPLGAVVVASPGSGILSRMGPSFGGALPVLGSLSGITFHPTANATLGAGGAVIVSLPPLLGGVVFAPFDTALAVLKSGTTTLDTTTSLPTVQASGFVHGPLSATSTAGQAGGVLQLISPTQVSSANTDTLELSEFGFFTRLTITLLPEPGALAAFASGAALLAGLGWWRRRRRS